MKLNPEIHRKIFYLLLMTMALALPLSIFMTSVVQFALFANWLLEGKYLEKWNRLRKEPAFWLLALFYIIHLVGMAWSKDLQYGLQDLKIKLPLLAIPVLIISSGMPDQKVLRQILALFIFGTVIASLFSILAMLNFIQVDKSDFRNVSLFMSHIRFALMVVLSIAFAVYLYFEKASKEPQWMRIAYLVSALWLLLFLFLLKSLSGIVIVGAILLYGSILGIRRLKDPVVRFMLTVALITVPLFAIIYVTRAVERFYTVEEIDLTALDSVTVQGNPYTFKLDNREIENGNYVWIYICPEELEQEWNRVSKLDYNGQTRNGQILRYTLIRYLTSKGLRKDAAGVKRLTPEDVDAIERGIANHIYLDRFALYPRIYQVIWEFDRHNMGYTANDKSIIQRFYYMEAGWNIARENLLFGVGTGDVKTAFYSYYKMSNTELRYERQRRAHNQYLTMLVSLGIPGFLLFLLAFLGPVFIKRKWKDYLVSVFLITMGLSMLNEDTLENTPGVVLMAFFYTLLIFRTKTEGEFQ